MIKGIILIKISYVWWLFDCSRWVVFFIWYYVKLKEMIKICIFFLEFKREKIGIINRILVFFVWN